ncbi:MAG: glycosyltransferase family 2 protein [Promethearchaeota archaeon]
MTKVAIITRTLNRSILLRRTAQDIMNQTFKDYIWVIVNDGEKETVNEIVSNFSEQKIIVIHNSKPIGMEAASNMGIKRSNSEYVVIHDDDDTWDPKFLEKTTSYLDFRGPSDIQQGVVTHCGNIIEEIVGNDIKIKERKPFNTWVKEITLFRILAGNFLAPISFLFRRSVFKEIGYFDENLPVLGDWDYFIRFLLKYEIGIIQEILAYYHQRKGIHSNTTISDMKSHVFYNALLRNRYLRKDIESGKVGVGFYINMNKFLLPFLDDYPRFKIHLKNIESQLQNIESCLQNNFKNDESVS